MVVSCAISNTEPETPVISPQGIIFEKRLIEKHLETSDTCPVTKEELSVKKLTEIRKSAFVKTEPARPSSLSNLITLFQNEWDAVMFENYALQEQLNMKKKDLSHSLYNHEAAARVILKLQQELAAARAENEVLRRHIAAGGGPQGDVRMEDAAADDETDALGVTTELTDQFKTTSDELLKTRKANAKKPQPGLATAEQMREFEVLSSNPVHSSTAPGVKAVDMKGNKIVSGGNDGAVVLFNKQKGKVVAKMTGHAKPVNMVEINDSGIIVSGSQDATARVWRSPDETNYSCAAVFRCHQREVTGISMHPAQDHVLTGSLDRSFALHDLNVGRVVYHAKDGEQEEIGEITALKLHPDGMIACSGSKTGECVVWDILTKAKLPLVLPVCDGPITSLNFSENGYFMVIANQLGESGGVVKLWDLRKVSCLQTLEFEDTPTCARFDGTGKYLGVSSGNAISVFNFATRSSLGEVVSLKGHEKAVQSLVFANNAHNLVSASLDRMVKIWGAPPI